MPLTTDKFSGNIFGFMTLEELMAGEDSEQERVTNWQEQIVQKKTDDNVRVQKVQHWNNHGIPRISKPISQPSSGGWSLNKSGVWIQSMWK
jgi:hypothetical protein